MARAAAKVPVVREPAAKGEAIADAALRRLPGYHLSRADIRMRKVFHRGLKDLALRPAEYSALVLIDGNPRINQKRLGAALDLAAPNLAVLLDRLTERGLVVRVRSEEDRRAQRLHLTNKGRTLLARAQPAVLAVEEEAFSRLSAGERAIFIELLQKVAPARSG